MVQEAVRDARLLGDVADAGGVEAVRANTRTAASRIRRRFSSAGRRGGRSRAIERSVNVRSE